MDIRTAPPSVPHHRILLPRPLPCPPWSRHQFCPHSMPQVSTPGAGVAPQTTAPYPSTLNHPLPWTAVFHPNYPRIPTQPHHGLTPQQVVLNTRAINLMCGGHPLTV